MGNRLISRKEDSQERKGRSPLNRYMAIISNDYDVITEFLASYLEKCGRDAASAEYVRQVERYADCLQKRDCAFLTCYTSVINILQGVQIFDFGNSECLIVANCERAVRDFLRNVPVGREFAFYFDDIYSDVMKEFLHITNSQDMSDSVRGLKLTHLSDVARGSGKRLDRVIGSKKDDVVSEFRQYTALKSRIETEHIVIEGTLMVRRALEDNLLVEKLVYADGIDGDIAELCRKNNVPYYKAAQGILSAMTTTNPVPEIICSVRLKALNQKNLIITKDKNFFLVLDGISNPDNLGMVLRTADAAGVNAVILLGNSTHHYNKNSIRGARGAVGRIPIYYCTDDFELMDILHAHHFKIMGTSARFQSSNFYDIQYDYDNIAVVIGNESNGVRKEILDLCTDYVKIPMAEGQSSLNIAVASALIMYEYDRAVYHNGKAAPGLA